MLQVIKEKTPIPQSEGQGDCCDSLPVGLPACAMCPLQLTQNAVVWLVLNKPKFSHTTPLLRTLNRHTAHPRHSVSAKRFAAPSVEVSAKFRFFSYWLHNDAPSSTVDSRSRIDLLSQALSDLLRLHTF